jgi:hypothetical protein
VADVQQSHLPVSVGQLTVTPEGWTIDASVPITEDWHGAAALSLDDGRVVGLVVFDKGQARIALAGPLVLAGASGGEDYVYEGTPKPPLFETDQRWSTELARHP